MTDKEKVNQVFTTSAYIVRVCYPVEPKRNKSYTFQDADLAAARQPALQKANQVATEKQAHEIIDVLIQLVETDRRSISDQHKVIATVYQQRLSRTMFMQDGKDLLEHMQLDAFTKKSLPPALFLTVGLEDNEAGNSQEFVVKSVTDVSDELAYYQQHGYSTNVPQHQS